MLNRLFSSLLATLVSFALTGAAQAERVQQEARDARHIYGRAQRTGSREAF